MSRLGTASLTGGSRWSLDPPRSQKNRRWIQAKSFAALQPGGGASNSIAFAWDRTAGKLHLDLNRNLDLTDDPAGVFGCPEKNYSRNYQTFTNIHLSFKTPAGSRQVLADLESGITGRGPTAPPPCVHFGRAGWFCRAWNGRRALWKTRLTRPVFPKAAICCCVPGRTGTNRSAYPQVRWMPFHSPESCLFKIMPGSWIAPANPQGPVQSWNCSSPGKSRCWEN